MKKFGVLVLLAIPAVCFGNHEMKHRDLNNGNILYKEHCSSCHGVRLEGEPNWQVPGEDGILPAPPHDESGHTWHHDNKVLFDYTKLGGKGMFEALGMDDVKSGMPGFNESLTDDDIWDVLAFIRSTWSDEIKQIQESLNSPHE